MAIREKVWRRLGSDLKPRHLQRIAANVDFAALPGVFDKILKSQIQGRTVIKIA